MLFFVFFAYPNYHLTILILKLVKITSLYSTDRLDILPCFIFSGQSNGLAHSLGTRLP